MDHNMCTLAVACAVAVKIKNKSKKRKRSKWSKEWLLKRNKFSHVNLLNELKLEPGDWFNYLRMDEDTYLDLLKLVTPLIEKKDTFMRQSITPHERLTATLRFLATGRSYEDLKFSVAISAQALGHIIPETCSAIYSVLKKDYMKFPATENDWKQIAKTFEERWNFPHCVGAVDGKHVQIVPPPQSGSYYWNYKGTHSLVLMAIANANYEFIMCNFGTNGRVSDGGVIEDTLFYRKLKNNTLHLPQAEKIGQSNEPLSFVFIGDEAFALRTDFLKPFSQKELTQERRIFNYRLSRARRIIENAFGILVARFRIFHSAIRLKIENIDKVVMATCILHNFMMRKRQEHYAPPNSLYTEDYETGVIDNGLRPEQNTVIDLQRGYNRHASENAKRMRDSFMTYFTNEGSIPWQRKFCNMYTVSAHNANIKL